MKFLLVGLMLLSSTVVFSSTKIKQNCKKQVEAHIQKTSGVFKKIPLDLLENDFATFALLAAFDEGHISEKKFEEVVLAMENESTENYLTKDNSPVEALVIVDKKSCAVILDLID